MNRKFFIFLLLTFIVFLSSSPSVATAPLEAQELMSLPYLQGYFLAPEEDNVIRYDRESAYDGFNLYCSGHGAEATLMDMKGNVVHQWRFDIKDIWPQFVRRNFANYWRRVHLFENGDLLAIFDHIGMIKVDKDSRLLWAFQAATHHHMQVTDLGATYVLRNKNRHIPRIRPGEDILEEYIAVLHPDGHVLKEYSLLKSFENSPYAFMLADLRPGSDIFHTNTIQVFDGHLEHLSPLFKKANVMVSVLWLNTIAIIDLHKIQVVWALEGSEHQLWNQMHEPVLLENGHILIFDNGGNMHGHGRSRVIEFDPFTKETVWEYKGTEQEPFESRTCGTVQRLRNGNTLITSSERGRAIEVTPDGEIVWEFINPNRAGKQQQLVATLFHLNRVERTEVSWLENMGE